MKLHNTITRGCGVSKGTVLSKRIMLGIIGWQYIGRSWIEFPICGKITKWKYVAYDLNGERIAIGDTMKEAEEFCLKMYKEFFESHPEEHDWLPDPYNRKKIVSKTIVVQEEIC